MKKKQIKLLAYVTFCLMFFFPVRVQAYIDPSTTSFAVQAVVAAAVAIGAGITVYWRKARKKVQDTLHIDENAGKEVESDEIESDPDKKTE